MSLSMPPKKTFDAFRSRCNMLRSCTCANAEVSCAACAEIKRIEEEERKNDLQFESATTDALKRVEKWSAYV